MHAPATSPHAMTRIPDADPGSAIRRSSTDQSWVRITSARDLRAIWAEIRLSARDYPVVGLSCRPGEIDPALPAARVREIVGLQVPVYVLEPHVARTTRTLTPKEHGVFGGAARVWWPGVHADSDPKSHPLFYDSTDAYGESTLEALAAEFRVRSLQPVHLPPEMRLVLQERLRFRAEKRNAELEGRLRAVEMECMRLRAQLADRSASESGIAIPAEPSEEGSGPRDAEPPSLEAVANDAGLGTAERLDTMIVQQWTSKLAGPYDWGDHPLARYTCSTKFLRALKRPTAPSLKRVARACAMVACGLAPELSGLDVRPLRVGSGGRRIESDSGAKRWRCGVSSGDGMWSLDYWTHPNGAIEFDDIYRAGRRPHRARRRTW
jgi:hypothetical protein